MSEAERIAEKLAAEVTFGSELGRYWFIYLVATVGGGGVGALIGWNTSRLLELADWIGLTAGATVGATVGAGAAYGSLRQVDKAIREEMLKFAIEAEKEMQEQSFKLRSEMSGARANLQQTLEKKISGMDGSVRKDVEAVRSQSKAAIVEIAQAVEEHAVKLSESQELLTKDQRQLARTQASLQSALDKINLIESGIEDETPKAKGKAKGAKTKAKAA